MVSEAKAGCVSHLQLSGHRELYTPVRRHVLDSALGMTARVVQPLPWGSFWDLGEAHTGGSGNTCLLGLRSPKGRPATEPADSHAPPQLPCAGPGVTRVLAALLQFHIRSGRFESSLWDACEPHRHWELCLNVGLGASLPSLEQGRRGRACLWSCPVSPQ